MSQKKTFKESLSPANQFISKPIEKPIHTNAPKINNSNQPAPDGYKINPIYIETKSKRVQILVQPSLFDKIKSHAQKNNTSVNDTIHSILESTFHDTGSYSKN